MKRENIQLKNWWLLKIRIINALILLPMLYYAQIANYVYNGGFEEKYNCNYPNELSRAKGWNSIGSDTMKSGGLLYSINCFSNAPLSSSGYQFPYNGHTYCRITLFCTNPCFMHQSRQSPKNRLKSNLEAGKTYCVKMYVNLQNTSPYAIKDLAIYFGDNSIDTINYVYSPLTYINPQITNTANVFFMDTLNWIPFTGTFTAAGTEKYLVIGNFTSDAATTKTLVLPSSTEVWAEYMIDDVSCIDIDLPAYAGPDVFTIPGNSVYLGRPQDVGIDEACMWYKLPDMTNAIDTAAGIWVNPTTTSTYVVKQEICAGIKYDTVVVIMSGVGFSPYPSASSGHGEFTIYPNPAKDEIELSLHNTHTKNLVLQIRNNIGQLLREEEVYFNNQKLKINTNLPNGIYFVTLFNGAQKPHTQKLVICRD